MRTREKQVGQYRLRMWAPPPSLSAEGEKVIQKVTNDLPDVKDYLKMCIVNNINIFTIIFPLSVTEYNV